MLIPETQQSRLMDLARSFILHALQHTPSPQLASEVDPDLLQPAGCFVSLHVQADHALRGCMGRIDATRPLVEALHWACEQVVHDPRFEEEPISLEELPRLEIEVSVLSPLVPAASPLDFEPLEQGIYLTHGKRTGCFLPQVARETGWSREQLLDRLCTEKLGLPRGAWRNPRTQLHVFSVQVIGPEPFQPGPMFSES